MYVNLTIEGITPILMNRFIEESEIKLSSGTSPREQAEKKAYRNKDTGELEFPCQNMMACVIEAGKFFTQKTSLIPAGVQVLGLTTPFGTKDFEVDSRSVVIPSTRGRIMCHRPRIDEWQLTFQLYIDEGMFEPKLVREVIDRAGKIIGLGDYRPQCKGSFGRFVVKNWQVIDESGVIQNVA